MLRLGARVIAISETKRVRAVAPSLRSSLASTRRRLAEGACGASVGGGAGLVIAARECPVSLDPAARCAPAGHLCREGGTGAKTMASVGREAVSCEG